MFTNVLLWFMLGIGASMLVGMFLYDGLNNIYRVLISIVGALIGGLILLFVAPDAQGWAILTALMGSIVAVSISWLMEQGRTEMW